jgi:hypothetical protein
LCVTTFRVTFWSRKLVHRRQYEIVELPAIGFETFKEIATFAERLFHGALQISQHSAVAVIEKIPADRRGFANE